jgi:hypothetical protein
MALTGGPGIRSDSEHMPCHTVPVVARSYIYNPRETREDAGMATGVPGQWRSPERLAE